MGASILEDELRSPSGAYHCFTVQVLTSLPLYGLPTISLVHCSGGVGVCGLVNRAHGL